MLRRIIETRVETSTEKKNNKTPKKNNTPRGWTKKKRSIDHFDRFLFLLRSKKEKTSSVMSQLFSFFRSMINFVSSFFFPNLFFFSFSFPLFFFSFVFFFFFSFVFLFLCFLFVLLLFFLLSLCSPLFLSRNFGCAVVELISSFFLPPFSTIELFS